MSAKAPVDVNKQTIHAIIPGLDYRAAKQINKLRQLVIIGFSIVGLFGFGGYAIFYLLDQFNVITITIVIATTIGVYFTTMPYLMRKWSIEWNQKMLV